MANVVLWLGGNFSRGYKAAEVAIQNPTTTVVVSTEGDPRRCLQLLLDSGIPRDRIVLDYQAWDTVTNFTKTWPIIRRVGARKVFVVTDGFHMKRSMAIANAVYWMRGVVPVACASSEVGSGEPEQLVKDDCKRAWLWRLTGYQHVWQDVYDRRWPGIEAEAKIAASL